jgi:hypothetical protein
VLSDKSRYMKVQFQLTLPNTLMALRPELVLKGDQRALINPKFYFLIMSCHLYCLNRLVQKELMEVDRE